MLVGASVAIVMLVINLAIPHRMRLIGVALLLIPQLYVPGFPVSLATVWTLLTCLAGLIQRGRSRADSPLVLLMGLYVATTAVSLLWALPSGVYGGVVNVVFGSVFLLWLREVIVVARDQPGILDSIMVWSIPGVAVQSLATIVFQVSPAFEGRFLRSGFAAMTMGPSAARLFTDLPNNVLSPSKAGGFFPNGNAASLFCSIAGLLLCVTARRTNQRWIYGFATLAFAGGVFTGSKTGLIVGPSMALLIVVLPHMLKRSAGVAVTLLSVVVLAPLAFTLLTRVVERVAPTFYAASDYSYGGREELWTRASQMLQDSPLLGVGFGGWAERVGRLGSRTDLPPHNFIIAAWVNSGVIAAVLATVFMVATVLFGLRVVAAQTSLHDRRTAVFALGAVVWVFLHGMGDNTGMYGDRYDMILFGLAIGYLYAIRGGEWAVATNQQDTTARAMSLRSKDFSSPKGVDVATL